MIHRFYVKNYMSIRDGVLLDFRIPRTTPKLDRFRESRSSPGVQLPTVILFVGPNGSGKTTVLKAIEDTAHFVAHSFTNNQEGQIVEFSPFNSTDQRYSPTRIEVDFDFDMPEILDSKFPTSLYRYSLEVEQYARDHKDYHRVVYEAVHIYPNRRPLRLFERKIGEPTYMNKNLGIGQKDERVLSVPSNASLISTLARFEVEPFQKLAQNADNIFSNMAVDKPWNPKDKSAIEIYKSSPDLAHDVSQLLSRLDLGIEKMEVLQTSNYSTLNFEHYGMDAPIEFFQESTGTRQLIKLLPLYRFALDSGGLAIIDNFDVELHEVLATELIQWFQSKKYNPRGAQLFCTSHNSSLLSELEKEEVYIVQKNRRNGGTSAFGVKDVQGVRRTEDLHKLYRGGVLDGIPFLE